MSSLSPLLFAEPPPRPSPAASSGPTRGQQKPRKGAGLSSRGGGRALRHRQGFLNSAFSQNTPKNRSRFPPSPAASPSRDAQEAASSGTPSFSPKNLPLLSAIAGASLPEHQPPPARRRRSFLKPQKHAGDARFLEMRVSRGDVFTAASGAPAGVAKPSCSVLPKGRKLEEPRNSPDNEEGAISIAFGLFPADSTLWQHQLEMQLWSCPAKPSQRQNK